jgi:aminopeptidase N
VETPPLSPDAISWMISVFKREYLESSSTYHATSTTTAIPIQSLTSASKVSDNLISNDKILRRNMTSILKTGLSIKMAKMSHEEHTHAPVTHKSESLTKDNDNHSTTASDDGIIRTAPSYTFYAPENILSKTRFILHTSRDILEHLQNWLNVPYPFSKLDFVALPSIQENLHSSLGLISCKTSFLKDASTVTSYEYQRSAIEISEAILQQYFGGMISPKIWKQNWLWDGIIRYLSRLIFAPLQPHWPTEEKYLLETKLRALDIDVLQGWESIENGTDAMGENNEFYIDKAASILEVLHSAMGEESFRSCIGAFITNFKYMTAEPNDLWSICSKKSKETSKNIKEIMHLWTSQSGFPLITVSKVNTTVFINQKIFKMADLVAVHEDPSFDQNENVTETTTMPTTTTTMSAKEAKKRLVKWIFPVKYITSNKDIKDSTWIDSIDGKRMKRTL